MKFKNNTFTEFSREKNSLHTIILMHMSVFLGNFLPSWIYIEESPKSQHSDKSQSFGKWFDWSFGNFLRESKWRHMTSYCRLIYFRGGKIELTLTTFPKNVSAVLFSKKNCLFSKVAVIGLGLKTWELDFLKYTTILLPIGCNLQMISAIQKHWSW